MRPHIYPKTRFYAIIQVYNLYRVGQGRLLTHSGVEGGGIGVTLVDDGLEDRDLGVAYRRDLLIRDFLANSSSLA